MNKMKTNGGYTIEDFQILKTPIERGSLEPHIYQGLVKKVPTFFNKKEDIVITWDQFGKCSNFERSDCFIGITEIKK